MRYGIIFAILGILFIIGCTPSTPDQIACTMDAKLCPDGSSVGRIAPNCEFEQCPAVNASEGVPGCDYNEKGMNYVSKDPRECTVINFACARDKEGFVNECGCGCKIKESSTSCNYESDAKRYVGKSADECSRIKFSCRSNEAYFSDECGCGCKIIEGEGKLQVTDCIDPRPQICTMQYDPACGWFDPAKIQCIKYPCANTYSNSCAACSDADVVSWSKGKCPE